MGISLDQIGCLAYGGIEEGTELTPVEVEMLAELEQHSAAEADAELADR
ncbi:hypothetical protein [Streptomyces specialis]|nr:hypothetical protein [Streptomyces specialis]